MNVVFFQVTHYRFSIAWTRILPNGTGDINQPGIDYYNAIIDMLIEANITPMITLYHWDLPQAIQENYGGWPNKTVAELFEQYADVCFREFGDRVCKHWISANQGSFRKKKCVSFSESKYRKYATQNGIL